MSSRAIIAVVPDLGYERYRSINQQRERLGSKNATLRNQYGPARVFLKR
jgi:hypothetical protein